MITKSLFLLLASLFTLTLHASSLKIASYNIKNFDYDERSHIYTDKPELARIIKNVGADILGLMEIVNTSEFLKFAATNLPQYKVALGACGGKGRQHLGFLYNPKKVELVSMIEDQRFQRTTVCNDGVRPAEIGIFINLQTKEHFVVTALHLKAGGTTAAQAERANQYTLIATLANELRAKGYTQMAFVGDFNTTEFLSKDALYQHFAKTMQSAGLVDTSESLGCTAYWWGGTNDQIDVGTILDHVVLSKELLATSSTYQVTAHEHCQRARCQPMSPSQLGASYNRVSDHCPVSVELK